MQKTNQEIFRIKKVIRKQNKKSFVKWYGYPDTFNSWVDNKELISLQKYISFVIEMNHIKKKKNDVTYLVRELNIESSKILACLPS